MHSCYLGTLVPPVISPNADEWGEVFNWYVDVQASLPPVIPVDLRMVPLVHLASCINRSMLVLLQMAQQDEFAWLEPAILIGDTAAAIAQRIEELGGSWEHPNEEVWDDLYISLRSLNSFVDRLERRLDAAAAVS